MPIAKLVIRDAYVVHLLYLLSTYITVIWVSPVVYEVGIFENAK